MSRLYILDGHTPVAVEDSSEGHVKWLQWMAAHGDRHVGDTAIGEVRVSTVFLGSDHGSEDVPMIFETMVFGGPLDEEYRRYSTWEMARAGHEVACRLVALRNEWVRGGALLSEKANG